MEETLHKCKMCGKPINGTRILCLTCLQRRRNFRAVVKWLESILGYPTDKELKKKPMGKT